MKNHAKKPTTETRSAAEAHVETVADAMRALHENDPWMLAALVDYIRQEWDGGPLPTSSEVSLWVLQRSSALVSGAVADAAANIVRVTVQS